jgi:4-amino-4-deoxychorismate lyase
MCNSEVLDSDFEPFSSVNGQADAPLSTFDRGLAYGDGLFETMRLAQGQLPFWPFHRERLFSGCGYLGIFLDPHRLEQYLADLLALSQERGIIKGLVKLIVTRGAAGRGYQPKAHTEPTVLLSVFPTPAYPRHYFTEGVAIYICQHRLPDNPALVGFKHLNKLDYVIAAQEWRYSGCAEALLFDRHGCLVEACSRNVFAAKGSRLLTPALHHAGVAGVLRKRIMEDYAKKLGRAVEESSLGLDDLLAADEIFLTNSITGVWPVKSLRGVDLEKHCIPQNAIGRELQRLYENDIQARVQGRAT